MFFNENVVFSKLLIITTISRYTVDVVIFKIIAYLTIRKTNKSILPLFDKQKYNYFLQKLKNGFDNN